MGFSLDYWITCITTTTHLTLSPTTNNDIKFKYFMNNEKVP